MKRLKISFFQLCNSLIATILGVIGLSSCKQNPIYPPVEYGCPHADFIVNGNVVDKDSDKPIENIRVVIESDTTTSIQDAERVRNDTTYTKPDGSYSFRQDLFEASDMVVKVKFEDIDSTANGEYESANTTLRISKEDFKGGQGRWFRGETKQTVDMKLTPKTKK